MRWLRALLHKLRRLRGKPQRGELTWRDLHPLDLARRREYAIRPRDRQDGLLPKEKHA